jgi:hypothetical protein
MTSSLPTSATRADFVDAQGRTQHVEALHAFDGGGFAGKSGGAGAKGVDGAGLFALTQARFTELEPSWSQQTGADGPAQPFTVAACDELLEHLAQSRVLAAGLLDVGEPGVGTAQVGLLLDGDRQMLGGLLVPPELEQRRPELLFSEVGRGVQQVGAGFVKVGQGEFGLTLVDENHAEGLFGLWKFAFGGSGVGSCHAGLERNGLVEVHDGVVVASKAKEVDLPEQQLHRRVVGVALLGVDEFLQGFAVFCVATRAVLRCFGFLGLAHDGDGDFVMPVTRGHVFLAGAMGTGHGKDSTNEETGETTHRRRIAPPIDGCSSVTACPAPWTQMNESIADAPDESALLCLARPRGPEPCQRRVGTDRAHSRWIGEASSRLERCSAPGPLFRDRHWRPPVSLRTSHHMRVIHRVAAVCLAVLCCLPACDCGLEPLAVAPGVLRGIACDPDSGRPIVDVDVSVAAAGQTLSSRTADDGSFRIANVPAGSAEVTLPGERTIAIVVIAGETSEVPDTACRGLPGVDYGSVRGQVCNGHVGVVVANADVLIVLPDDSRLATTTDAEGFFSFSDVPVGTHALSVRGEGYSRSEAITVVANVETVVDVGDACAIPAPIEVGGVRGRVCTPDGQNALTDARASISPVGMAEIASLTDADGRFLLEGVPSGNQLLIIQKGTFRSEQTVTIPVGSILQLDEQDCQLQPDAIRIAVVRGSEFDHVEQVLGSLGIDEGQIDIYGADWAEVLLDGDERVRDYDVLFLNCRSAEPAYLASSIMRDRLRGFINDGGSLYGSDQAYDLIEGTFPDKVEFVGNDGTRGAADKGASVDSLGASIVDFNMASLFGRSSATLHYPLASWSVVSGVASGVTVYLTADAALVDGGRVNDAPQIVGFDHGQGRVTYSSFHQEPGSHPDQLRILQLLMFEL